MDLYSPINAAVAAYFKAGKVGEISEIEGKIETTQRVVEVSSITASEIVFSLRARTS